MMGGEWFGFGPNAKHQPLASKFRGETVLLPVDNLPIDQRPSRRLSQRRVQEIDGPLPG
jgi:hypothetical protein